jgi:hypothetical protein
MLGSLTGGNSIPKVFSHELVEALTDPNVATGPLGITFNGARGNGKVGDLCNNTFQIVNGHAEEAYWSQFDKRCVMPVHPSITANMVLIQSKFGTSVVNGWDVDRSMWIST